MPLVVSLKEIFWRTSVTLKDQWQVRYRSETQMILAPSWHGAPRKATIGQFLLKMRQLIWAHKSWIVGNHIGGLDLQFILISVSQVFARCQ